jgi:chemotaxis protein methyltransferase CheR
LSKEILPQYVSEGKRKIKIWSAACSSGEEPYTISIVLNEFIEQNAGFTFSILGTDISSNVLNKAMMGIYAEKSVDVIPMHLKRKYFLRSKDRHTPTVRVIPQLQKNISLKYLNLMDSVYDITEKYDVIFCRNVLIYFDHETQEKVINKLCRHLIPGGYLFIGHSESVANMEVPLQSVKPTIFKKI